MVWEAEEKEYQEVTVIANLYSACTRQTFPKCDTGAKSSINRKEEKGKQGGTAKRRTEKKRKEWKE